MGRKKKAAGKRARTAPHVPSREALLAATLLQAKPGDLVLAEPGDRAMATLAQNEMGTDPPPPSVLPESASSGSRLLLITAMAAALRAGKTDRFAVGYLRAESAQPGWETALTWAQEHLLPLILVCADPRGPETFRPAKRPARDVFSWAPVQRTAGRLQLPILTVDGEDAVAVYRVMQESVLRARAGGGPAILWAMLPSPSLPRVGRPGNPRPLSRLEGYLRARGVSF